MINDPAFMHRALELAEQGRGWVEPNVLVGAVLVKDGKMIGEGWHQRFGCPHAEVEAIADAQAHGNDPQGATLYVTLEPCAHHGKTPPCTDAVIAAGIRHVVIGVGDPNPVARGGAEILRKAGIDVDLLTVSEARELNRGFFRSIEEKRPFVCVKVAVSADNKITRAVGTRTQISGSEAQAYTHNLRARYDAILVGANTVLVDDPQLTARIENPPTWFRQPLRVILDAHGCIPLTAKVFTDRHCLILTTNKTPTEKIEPLRARADVVVLPAINDRIPFSAVLAELASRGIRSVLIEGGSAVLTQCVEENVADQWIILRSSETFGTGVDFMDDPQRFYDHFQKKRSIIMGKDTIEIYAPTDIGRPAKA